MSIRLVNFAEAESIVLPTWPTSLPPNGSNTVCPHCNHGYIYSLGPFTYAQTRGGVMTKQISKMVCNSCMRSVEIVHSGQHIFTTRIYVSSPDDLREIPDSYLGWENPNAHPSTCMRNGSLDVYEGLAFINHSDRPHYISLLSQVKRGAEARRTARRRQSTWDQARQSAWDQALALMNTASTSPTPAPMNPATQSAIGIPSAPAPASQRVSEPTDPAPRPQAPVSMDQERPAREIDI